jgi:hypothetical protein
MKKVSFITIICSCYLFTGCNTTSPERYFDLAVLNSNMMMGFANDGLQRELEQPSVKMPAGNKDKVEPMKRKEIIDGKIQYVEEELGKLKKLDQTDDAKGILQASLALNEYVLPVYKTEYLQLATLYDGGASKAETEAFSKAIHDKYYSRFDELYNKLITAGKAYAERHTIKVNWRN